MYEVASPFELAHGLQNGLISTATSGGFDWDEEYIQLRSYFMKRPDIK
jgi:hypothetical protein